MTPEEYSQVIAACDQILNESELPLEFVAIPWLQVLNEHPSNLARYEDLFFSKQGTRKHLVRAIQVGKKLIKNFRKVSEPLSQATSRVEVLFFSHLVSADMADHEEDFYFGDIQKRLESQQISSAIALFNQTEISNETLEERVARELPRGRFLLSLRNSFKQNLKMLGALFGASRQLRRVARQTSNPLLRKVAYRAAFHACTDGALSNLLLHQYVKTIVARLRPKAVVVTYEGHAWERMVFHAARQAIPSILCVGYQHTILFARQHAALRRLGKGFDPDTIITVGEYNKAKIQSRMPEITVEVYGSHRISVRRDVHISSRPLRCLVLPDGILSECEILFDYTILASLALPHVEFVLRTHPIMPYSRVARIHRRFRRLPPNISLSKGETVWDDSVTCRWALYRGSSAVFASVVGGARPIYLSQGESELDIDSLGDLRTWRRTVRLQSDLAAIVEQDLITSEESLQAEASPAIEYCVNYAVSPRIAAFNSILCNS